MNIFYNFLELEFLFFFLNITLHQILHNVTFYNWEFDI